MTWFVYILECADGTLYTGVTTDVTRRIRQHNGELAGGARYTSTRRPVRLRYHQPTDSRSHAQQLEYQIKQMSRKEKLQLHDATIQ